MRLYSHPVHAHVRRLKTALFSLVFPMKHHQVRWELLHIRRDTYTKARVPTCCCVCMLYGEAQAEMCIPG